MITSYIYLSMHMLSYVCAGFRAFSCAADFSLLIVTTVAPCVDGRQHVFEEADRGARRPVPLDLRFGLRLRLRRRLRFLGHLRLALFLFLLLEVVSV